MISPYDYLPTIIPDYITPLDIIITGNIGVSGPKNQKLHWYDDGSRPGVMSLADDSQFYFSFGYDQLTPDGGSFIFDYYHNPAKANGAANTFPWPNPWDYHTYVVMFLSEMPQNLKDVRRNDFPDIKLLAVGKILDA